MRERYYIDQRVGCIAIVDRSSPDHDPDYQGLEEGSNGVVWYEHGVLETRKCRCCGNKAGEDWALKPGALERAEACLAALSAARERGDA